MDLGKIISNSIRYPFRNIRKLPVLFILFILVSTIPVAWISDNRYLLIFGSVSFFIFILLVPGYLFSMVKIGLNESSLIPSFNLKNALYDSIRVLVLRAAYMIVPAVLFLSVLSVLSVSGWNMIWDVKFHPVLLTLILLLIVSVIVFVIFEVLLFFAKARMAYFDSLCEALKIQNVIGDIKNIGVVNIIKWMIFMAVLMIVFSAVSYWVMALPYVGFLIYIGIVVPVLESIGNYSFGLLYSNITDDNYHGMDIKKRKN